MAGGRFLRVDLLALYIAFRVNFAEAKAMEEVVVSRIEVLVRQVSARGEAREWRFNPAWTRMEIDRHAEFGVMGLALVSRGQSVPIGVTCPRMSARASPRLPQRAGRGAAIGPAREDRQRLSFHAGSALLWRAAAVSLAAQKEFMPA